MPVRHTVENEVTTSVLHSATVIDATPETSTDFDVRTFDPGSRFLLLLNAFETVATNTGGTWTVTESETDGGVYTTATTSGSLAATGAVAGDVLRTVSLLPNPAKPFVHAVFTGADASTDVHITAVLVALPRGLL